MVSLTPSSLLIFKVQAKFLSPLSLNPQSSLSPSWTPACLFWENWLLIPSPCLPCSSGNPASSLGRWEEPQAVLGSCGLNVPGPHTHPICSRALTLAVLEPELASCVQDVPGSTGPAWRSKPSKVDIPPTLPYTLAISSGSKQASECLRVLPAFVSSWFGMWLKMDSR